MKKLFCDLDDVICENELVKYINKFLHTNYTFEEIPEGYIFDDSMIPSKKKRDKLADYIIKKDFYKHAVLKEGAYETLKRLQEERGYEIHICSACLMINREVQSGKIFHTKFDYITRALPFVNPRNIIFTNRKDACKGDVMIDDRLSNLGGEFETKLLFDCWYNRKYKAKELKEMGVTRVKSWSDIEKILTKKK